MVLVSTNVGDQVFDPFASYGTTLIVADQLQRNSVGLENEDYYVELIADRSMEERPADDISRIRNYYRFTTNFDELWPNQ